MAMERLERVKAVPQQKQAASESHNEQMVVEGSKAKLAGQGGGSTNTDRGNVQKYISVDTSFWVEGEQWGFAGGRVNRSCAG